MTTTSETNFASALNNRKPGDLRGQKGEMDTVVSPEGTTTKVDIASFLSHFQHRGRVGVSEDLKEALGRHRVPPRWNRSRGRWMLGKRAPVQPTPEQYAAVLDAREPGDIPKGKDMDLLELPDGFNLMITAVELTRTLERQRLESVPSVLVTAFARHGIGLCPDKDGKLKLEFRDVRTPESYAAVLNAREVGDVPSVTSVDPLKLPDGSIRGWVPIGSFIRYLRSTGQALMAPQVVTAFARHGLEFYQDKKGYWRLPLKKGHAVTGGGDVVGEATASSAVGSAQWSGHDMDGAGSDPFAFSADTQELIDQYVAQDTTGTEALFSGLETGAVPGTAFGQGSGQMPWQGTGPWLSGSFPAPETATWDGSGDLWLTGTQGNGAVHGMPEQPLPVTHPVGAEQYPQTFPQAEVQTFPQEQVPHVFHQGMPAGLAQPVPPFYGQAFLYPTDPLPAFSQPDHFHSWPPGTSAVNPVAPGYAGDLTALSPHGAGGTTPVLPSGSRPAVQKVKAGNRRR
ncbi:hypothetical protein AB0E08_06085 [Streptomyces sp. NPDC048281]|uniref:hypothetical protein n=1 Tax=Streptomyces sp. NPDC048281 TaxID=3154715 RepID=UPI00341CCD57